MASGFGDWFVEQLTKHNYAERKFARMVGVSDATVRNWKRGARPQWEQTAKLARALRVDVSEVRRQAGYTDGVGEEAPAEASTPVLSDEEELLVRAWRVAEPSAREVLLAGARAIAEAAGEHLTGEPPPGERPEPRRAGRGGR